jgi:hypothetical protein
MLGKRDASADMTKYRLHKRTVIMLFPLPCLPADEIRRSFLTTFISFNRRNGIRNGISRCELQTMRIGDTTISPYKLFFDTSRECAGGRSMRRFQVLGAPGAHAGLFYRFFCYIDLHQGQLDECTA